MQKVLITGGNGDIGKAIYNELIQGEIVKDHIPLQYEPYKFSRQELDVTDHYQVENIISCLKPHILINNAGFIVANSIKELSDYNWEKQININLNGVFYCSKHAIKNGCHTVINIGSTSGFEAREGWSAYCVSKAGVLALTECLVKEGFKAYSLNPTRTDTKMRQTLFPNEDKTTLMEPKRVAEFVMKILNGEFENGSHIVVKKDTHVVIPMRKGV